VVVGHERARAALPGQAGDRHADDVLPADTFWLCGRAYRSAAGRPFGPGLKVLASSSHDVAAKTPHRVGARRLNAPVNWNCPWILVSAITRRGRSPARRTRWSRAARRRRGLPARAGGPNASTSGTSSARHRTLGNSLLMRAVSGDGPKNR